MAIRYIIDVDKNEEQLRKTSKPVKIFDEKLHTLLDDMKETMEKAEGVGLAAVQVGILRRAIVIEYEDQYYELINPEILSAKGAIIGEEGCLSIPGKTGTVIRPQKVKVKSQDRYGKSVNFTVKDFVARIFCHEIDHLDGTLYIDKTVLDKQQE